MIHPPVYFLIDGIQRTTSELQRLTGLSWYTLKQAFARDPTLSSLAAIKANVVAYKSHPIVRKHVPVTSLRWNNTAREDADLTLRARLSKRASAKRKVP